MANLREQMIEDVAAVTADTDEFAEAIEFAGQTTTPAGGPLTGIIGNTAFTLPGGGAIGGAQTKTTLQVMRASLTTVPAIGDLTTLNGAEVLVVDRQEPIAGVLVYVLQ